MAMHTMHTMHRVIEAAHGFLLENARVLERRVFDSRYLGMPADGVLDALRGYRNDDGGFGHALEPDNRCPASLPIDVEIAVKTMADVCAADAEMVRRACDYLAQVADDADAGGAVPLATPVIEAYPRAEHMSDWAYVPGLNPTAGLVGTLRRLGADHPWIARAEAACWQALDDGGGWSDAHELSESLIFLAHVADRDRADQAADRLAENLDRVRLLHLDPHAEEYGLTPLRLAPTPDSPWRRFFTDEQLDAHLDRLAADQQTDGGWPISWDPPTGAAALEWRGIATLMALEPLSAYGRLD
jgi:hypothetical protein